MIPLLIVALAFIALAVFGFTVHILWWIAIAIIITVILLASFGKL